MSIEATPGLREFLLAFADDEHFMGQHHTEWIGVAPFLEEDLALASIGQDELGHAAMLYELVLELDGIEATDIEIDRLAYRRADDEYLSCPFTEYPTTDWAEALVRHWIYDTFESLRWGLVAESSYQPLADAAVRAGREEIYHLRHADALIDTLMVDAEARERLMAAVLKLERLAYTLPSDTSSDEDRLVAAGIISDHMSTLDRPLMQAIATRFETQLRPRDLPEYDRAQRSEPFGPLIARMREVFDLDPSAVW
ncbi:MAG: ring-1,2-phenylacetyl-CoA epoxidase subunit PaaC [Verrucomicrobiales bacterium]|jgi:ring-1,2-phenylacetyl-CoA epoxidase subunit PaaC